MRLAGLKHSSKPRHAAGGCKGREMIRYHYFNSQAEADVFLASLRANGGLGYSLGRLCDQYEVREIA